MVVYCTQGLWLYSSEVVYCIQVLGLYSLVVVYCTQGLGLYSAVVVYWRISLDFYITVLVYCTHSLYLYCTARSVLGFLLYICSVVGWLVGWFQVVKTRLNKMFLLYQGWAPFNKRSMNWEGLAPLEFHIGIGFVARRDLALGSKASQPESRF